MSFLTQTALESDLGFSNRTRACLTGQSVVFLNDGRADIVALAEALLRDEPGPSATFLRMLAGAPGFADKVEGGPDGIDSSKIADSEILSAVQAEYPTVAGLYFNDDGTPITGA